MAGWEPAGRLRRLPWCLRDGWVGVPGRASLPQGIPRANWPGLPPGHVHRGMSTGRGGCAWCLERCWAGLLEAFGRALGWPWEPLGEPLDAFGRAAATEVGRRRPGLGRGGRGLRCGSGVGRTPLRVPPLGLHASQRAELCLRRADAAPELLELRGGEGGKLGLRGVRGLVVDHGEQQQLLRRVRRQPRATPQQRQQLRDAVRAALGEVREAHLEEHDLAGRDGERAFGEARVPVEQRERRRPLHH